MDELIKDVKPRVEPVIASTTDIPQVVKEPATDTQVTQDTQDTTTQTPPVVGQSTVEALDEFGVPWKNRAFEFKRKTEDLAESLPKLIDEKLSQLQTQNKPREYTIAELESFAAQSPQHRPWVEEEKSKLMLKQFESNFESKLQAQEKAKQDEIKRQNSYRYVATNYPDAFTKDAQGNITGWNNTHPLVQQIGVFMNDKRVSNDPEGLAFAADAAYGRLQRMQNPIKQQQAQVLKEEVRHLQRGQMIEGGSKTGVNPLPTHRQAIEQLKKTGSLKDAKVALGEILKARMSSTTED